MSFIHSSSNLLSTQSDEGRRNGIDHHQVFHQFNSLLSDQDLSPLSASSSFSSSSLTSSSSHSGRNFSSCESLSSGRFHSRSSENLPTRITSSSSFCNSSSKKRKRRRNRPSSTSSSSNSLLSNSFFHTDDEDEEKDGGRMRKKVYPFSRSSRMLKMNRIPIQKLFVILLSSFISSEYISLSFFLHSFSIFLLFLKFSPLVEPNGFFSRDIPSSQQPNPIQGKVTHIPFLPNLQQFFFLKSLFL